LDVTAADEMSLPEVKEKLKTYLGPRYQHNDWKIALSIVLEAEDNMTAAIEAVYWLLIFWISKINYGESFYSL
jgi:hypothetical protein